MTEAPNRALFRFPEQARVGRVLPKARIYEHAGVSGAMRDKFVAEVEQIIWAYKLAPETLNLRAHADVLEIQVFDIALKGEDVDEDVLRTIDRAIPHPIVFQLWRGQEFRTVAAFKRRSHAGMDKPVIDGYLSSPWLPHDSARQPLPISLDLKGLYEQLLRSLLPLPARHGETLREQLARLDALRSRQNEYLRLQTRLRRERQFNRKVTLNAQLRALKNEIGRLNDPQDEPPAA
ncbi:MAG: DUF4391 domain-containing protein [Proteobacteria bacterium]|nr:DUF4391 domain-containing protein [Pseudomonadota bacterium]